MVIKFLLLDVVHLHTEVSVSHTKKGAQKCLAGQRQRAGEQRLASAER